MAAYRRVYDSRYLRLTAKNRDQLRNSALGDRVWATFTFSVILIDSSMGSPVHVLMLYIQAVRGLPRLRASDIVSCIISLSRQ